MIKNVPSDLRYDFSTRQAKDNRSRLLFVVPFFGFISLIYLLQHLMAPMDDIEYTAREIYRWVFAGGVIISLLFLLLLNLVKDQDSPEQLIMIQKLFISIFLTWITFLSVNDLSVSDDMNAFIIGIVSTAIIMRGAFLFTSISIITIGCLTSGILIALSGKFPTTQLMPILVYTIIGLLINLVLENALVESFNANFRLKQRNDELRMISFKDHLTQLYNRRYVMEYLENINKQMEKKKSPFCIIILDIDHFKKVNNLLGHPLGDNLLQEMALVTQNKVRTADIIGRYGGEQFIIILPDTLRGEAVEIGESLRSSIESMNFQGIPWKITISLGCSEKKSDESLESFIKRTDEYLTQAKKFGRNKIVSSV